MQHTSGSSAAHASGTNTINTIGWLVTSWFCLKKAVTSLQVKPPQYAMFLIWVSLAICLIVLTWTKTGRSQRTRS